VRILAHRGSPTPSTVENTVPAIAEALAAGADGVEVDLRLSADGVLVVCHDPDVRRVTGRDLDVAGSSWEALRAGTALARVEWVLAAAAGRPVVLELKAPPPAPRARARTVEALAERLAALHDMGLPMEVTVSSFDASLARLARAKLSGRTRTALLGRPGVRVSSLLRQALAAGHDEVHPHVLDTLAVPKAVAAAHALGLAVVPWTVNGRGALRRCVDLGVDAVITDVPVTARQLLARRAAA
jgi:glycerophosphoryl diester phosphodiesterase